MRALILGAEGQVGHELAFALGTFATIIGKGRNEADLTRPQTLRAVVEEARPDVILNAASYNDVDGAEREPDVALRVNAESVAELGKLAKERRIGVVHYSTDFVFDGKASAPYKESEPVAPINAYGRSKLAGEEALREAPALVFRTAWVFSTRRKCFVTSMLRFARQNTSLRVVSDQIGSPTFCRDLAQATALVVYSASRNGGVHETFTQRRGVYHVTNAGTCSRYELAMAALALDPKREEHIAKEILPIPSAEFPLPAPRPLYTALDGGRLAETFGIRLPDWRDALRRAFA